MPPVKSAKKKEEQLMEEVKEIRKANKENLVCADCPNRAPAYVCTSFATFVCTECSGVHRKFGHRVKSIAMANFTEEEVEKLRTGGNEVANAHYLARYKKGKDTFILPREGERDRMEQYLTYKYVEKKWYKEKVKMKEKKGKKAENKKSGDDSDSEREEGASTPVATPAKTPQRTLAPTSSMTSTNSTTSSKAALQQPSDDFLFDSTSTQTKTVTSSNTKADDDDLFGNTNGNSGWDIWGEETTTATTTTSTAKPVTKQQDDWGDDLWDNNSTTTTTSTIATTTTSTAPTKRTSQNLTNLYQVPNPAFNNTYQNPLNMNANMDVIMPNMGMTVPMNSNYIMPNQGGMINTWPSNTGVVPIATTPIQPSPVASQGNLFLGVLTQVNQQKQEEEDKKKKEQAPKATTTATETKDLGDPFASLVDDLDLSLKENTVSTNSTGIPSTTMPPLTKRVSGINSSFGTTPTSTVPTMPLTSTYGPNTNQAMFGNHSYFPTPNPPPNVYNPSGNIYMTSPPMYGGISYMGPVTVSNNPNMYANFPNNVSAQPQPNMWNNSSFGTVGGTASDSDNPFR